MSCGNPSKGSHTVEITNTGTGYGDIIEVECDAGYELDSGDLLRECQADKSWSGEVPVCSGKFVIIRSKQEVVIISQSVLR